MGDKIRSSAPSTMLYQKVLTVVFVGVVFQWLTCRFIAGHFLPLRATAACKRGQLEFYYCILNLSRAPKLTRVVLWTQLDTLWIAGTPTIIIIPRIIQNVSVQLASPCYNQSKADPFTVSTLLYSSALPISQCYDIMETRLKQTLFFFFFFFFFS